MTVYSMGSAPMTILLAASVLSRLNLSGHLLLVIGSLKSFCLLLATYSNPVEK